MKLRRTKKLCHFLGHPVCEICEIFINHSAVLHVMVFSSPVSQEAGDVTWCDVMSCSKTDYGVGGGHAPTNCRIFLVFVDMTSSIPYIKDVKIPKFRSADHNSAKIMCGYWCLFCSRDSECFQYTSFSVSKQFRNEDFAAIKQSRETGFRERYAVLVEFQCCSVVLYS